MSLLRSVFRLRAILPAAAVLLLSSCSSSKLSTSDALEKRYQHAVGLMQKEDFDLAAIELESLMFSTRATELEDDVLYSLGKSYYFSDQYLLASEIFRRLTQQNPESPFARDAQFQLAKSCEQLSPHFERDQEFTEKAIIEFKQYLDLYPVQDSTRIAGDVDTYRELLKVNPGNRDYQEKYERAQAELGQQAPAMYSMKVIPVLREKLARNRYSIARNYVQLKKYRAASIYFDEVIRSYPDTGYLEQAWMGKIDMAVKRKKWFEARQAIEQFQQLFPEKQEKVDGVYKTVLEKFSQS
jgi:outer membrane protein assembly factor BamD